MKRVAFVTPKMGIGGVERSLLALLSQMPKQEFDVTLLLFERGGELEDLVPYSVKICNVMGMEQREKLRSSVSKILQIGCKPLHAVVKGLYHRLGAHFVIRDQEIEHYDVAIAYSDGLATWYTAKNVCAEKKIAFVHTDVLQAQYDAKHESAVYRAFQYIYLSSSAAKEHFLTMLPECEGKTQVLHSLVDGQLLRRLAKEAAPVVHQKNQGLCILTIGRLNWEKGITKVPALLNKLKQDGITAAWYIAGDGPEHQNILWEAQRLGVSSQLHLLGNLKNPYPLLQMCDIYVQPSNYEGYCIAVAEARVLCKPIVACDFAGAREQLNAGKSGLITGMSVEEIYPSLKRLAEDATLREKFVKTLQESQEVQDISAALWWQTL